MLRRNPILETLHRIKSAVAIQLLKPEKVGSPASMLAEQARVRGRKVFMLFEGRQITFDEADREVTRYARAAAALGLKKGDVAAVVMENRPEYLFTVYGLNRIGVTAALINTNLTGRPLEHVLGAGDMKAFFIGAECLDHVLPALRNIQAPMGMVLIERSEKPSLDLPEGLRDLHAVAHGSPNALSGHTLNAAIGGDWLCYIYTSGTTGLPKAGRFPNMRWFGGAHGIAGVAASIMSDDVIYVCLPLYHASAFVLGVAPVLLFGGQIALARKFSASRFWDDVRKYDATAFVYIGEICRYLTAQPASSKDKTHRIRAVFGNGMRPDVWREFTSRFGIERVHEFYAATEGNANMVNMNGHVGAVGQLNLLTKLAYNTVLVKWNPLTEQPIRNAAGYCIPCDVDEPGELLGKIDPQKVQTRFDGYADPAATEKKILRGVFEPGDSYFRTGDLLRCDAEGYFYFVDRVGDTFRWKGENVSTNEVADVLTMHNQIEVANVYGVAISGHDGRAGMAAINTPGNEEPDWKTVFEHIRKNLPDYAQPVFLRWQKEADLTGTFKLRKVELQQEGFNPSASKDPIYFRDLEQGCYVLLDAVCFERIETKAVRV